MIALAVRNAVRRLRGLPRMVRLEDSEWRLLIERAAISPYLERELEQTRAKLLAIDAARVVCAIDREGRWGLTCCQIGVLAADPPVGDDGRLDEQALRDRVLTRLSAAAVEQLLATVGREG